jgi:hypothetical protein
MRALPAIALGVLSCATPPTLGDISLGGETRPSLEQFRTASVGLFVEQRCGSLDCHGQPGRPLRIFGPYGLRAYTIDDGGPLDSGLTPGSSVVFDVERRLNYLAIIGLEPEVLRTVLAAKGDDDCLLPGESAARIPPSGPDRCYRRLLFLAKPLACSSVSSAGCDDGLGAEHKGGPVIALGGEGYECLVSWLRGNASIEACTAATIADAGH